MKIEMVTAHEKKMMTIQKVWESLRGEKRGVPNLAKYVQKHTNVNMRTAQEYSRILENLGSVYSKVVALNEVEVRERGLRKRNAPLPPYTEKRYFALVSAPPVQVKDGVGGLALQSEVAGLDVEKKE